MASVLPGCESLLKNKPAWFSSARLGLLANQASYTSRFEPVWSIIRKAGGRLARLFSPQHGFHGEKQANMVESEDGWEDSYSIPVFSLYGQVREPTAQMMEKIDVLLIDLQDVGTRVYTFGTTMGLCLEAAARAGVKTVVLDRPNPIDGISVEGNILQEEYRSFVGRYPIPMRHGLTMGELARFIAARLQTPCDLEVIPMIGWRRSWRFPETGLPWFFPSPNMPTWETALLYPGMVLFEGTNVSEGRGTTLPFHIFGAPFIDQEEMKRILRNAGLEGVHFRPISFEPVFDKWKGEVCRGFQIHVTDYRAIRPYRMALALLRALCLVHGNEFRWLPPPYEYERKKLPIEILLGNGSLRKDLESGANIEEIENRWRSDLEVYSDEIASCLLYS